MQSELPDLEIPAALKQAECTLEQYTDTIAVRKWLIRMVLVGCGLTLLVAIFPARHLNYHMALWITVASLAVAVVLILAQRRMLKFARPYGGFAKLMTRISLLRQLRHYQELRSQCHGPNALGHYKLETAASALSMALKQAQNGDKGGSLNAHVRLAQSCLQEAVQLMRAA